MTPNPKFKVRFYIRAAQRKDKDAPAPLRVKVWMNATKRYLYLTTNTPVTPRQFAEFETDGTPSMKADPKLIKVVDKYKAAVYLVISSAIVNNRIDTLTSRELESRVEGVIVRMDANAKSGNNRIISPFAEPRCADICRECIFCGERCKYPWNYGYEAERAVELAEFNNMCAQRCVRTPKGIMWQTTPAKPPRPFEEDNNAKLIAIIKKMEKGGNDGK